MRLTVDIGNTNITAAVFRNNQIIKKFDIATRSYSLVKFKRHLGAAKFDDAIIAGVVPSVLKTLSGDLKRLTKKNPWIAGKNIFIPIKNCYYKPGQTGIDRLLNAYAAVRFYGAPAIIIDCGTATTFDIVSRDKRYLGGMILPGMQASLTALAQNTALLPKLKLAGPRQFIGQDTKTSILSGIVYGFACLTDSMVGKIKKKIGKNALVIGTGGNIKLIAKYCPAFDIIDPELTLKGLNLLLQDQKRA
jgi:type III pantothenate kinase